MINSSVLDISQKYDFFPDYIISAWSGTRQGLRQLWVLIKRKNAFLSRLWDLPGELYAEQHCLSRDTHWGYGQDHQQVRGHRASVYQTWRYNYHL